MYKTKSAPNQYELKHSYSVYFIHFLCFSFSLLSSLFLMGKMERRINRTYESMVFSSNCFLWTCVCKISIKICRAWCGRYVFIKWCILIIIILISSNFFGYNCGFLIKISINSKKLKRREILSFFNSALWSIQNEKKIVEIDWKDTKVAAVICGCPFCSKIVLKLVVG